MDNFKTQISRGGINWILKKCNPMDKAGILKNSESSVRMNTWFEGPPKSAMLLCFFPQKTITMFSSFRLSIMEHSLHAGPWEHYSRKLGFLLSWNKGRGERITKVHKEENYNMVAHFLKESTYLLSLLFKFIKLLFKFIKPDSSFLH